MANLGIRFDVPFDRYSFLRIEPLFTCYHHWTRIFWTSSERSIDATVFLRLPDHASSLLVLGYDTEEGDHLGCMHGYLQYWVYHTLGPVQAGSFVLCYFPMRRRSFTIYRSGDRLGRRAIWSGCEY